MGKATYYRFSETKALWVLPDGRTVIKDASPAALKRMPKAPRELMHREVARDG